jgi:protein TonB
MFGPLLKFIPAFSAVLILTASVYAQSGRRGTTIVVPVPPPEVVEPIAPVAGGRAPVSAQKNEDYRCTDDGSLASIPPTEAEEEVEKEKPDTPAQILSKPTPSYTKEARRLGVQGQVILKVLLSSQAGISRIRVHRGLPAGLTENAIHAACKIKFKPALKNGVAVSRWVTVEYAFRVSQPSIFSR